MKKEQWEWVSANDVKPGDVVRFGTVTNVIGAGRLRIIECGPTTLRTMHAAKPVEVLR
jgi:hypothetical protein